MSKIQKEDEKVVKGLQTSRKAVVDYAKERDKAHKEILKAQQTVAKNEANAKKEKVKEVATAKQEAKAGIKDKAQGAGNRVAQAAGGDFIGAIGSALPYVGAILVAAAAAMQKAVASFGEAARIEKERANVKRVESASQDLKDLKDQLKKNGFSEKDSAEAITELSKANVGQIDKEDIQTIVKEAKRQGSATGAARTALTGEGLEQLGQQGKYAKAAIGGVGSSVLGADIENKARLGFLRQAHQSEYKQVNAQTQLSKTAKATGAKNESFQYSEENRARNLSSQVGLEEANLYADTQNTLVAGAAHGANETAKFAKNMQDKSLKFNANPLSSDFGTFTKRASGGGVESGKPYMVGEKGPELFKPQNSGRIFPSGSQNQSGGSKGVNVTFNINGVTDPETVAKICAQKFTSLLNTYANTTMARELNMGAGIG